MGRGFMMSPQLGRSLLARGVCQIFHPKSSSFHWKTETSNQAGQSGCGCLRLALGEHLECGVRRHSRWVVTPTRGLGHLRRPPVPDRLKESQDTCILGLVGESDEEVHLPSNHQRAFTGNEWPLRSLLEGRKELSAPTKTAEPRAGWGMSASPDSGSQSRLWPIFSLWACVFPKTPNG